MMTALMYAELSSRIPISGSAYSYTYATVGELPAWLVAWNMNLRYGAASAGLSRGMCEYGTGLVMKFGINLPPLITGFKFLGFEKCSILAVIFLYILTEVFVRGMEKSNIFNFVLTVTKVTTLLIIIILATFNFDTANLSPFTLEKYGYQGTLYGASLIYFGYLGFDMITTLSDEAKNPVRDVPLSVRDNNLIVTCIYFTTAFMLASIARLENFHSETAFAEAFTSIGMPWVTKIIYFCAFIGITATCFSQHIVS